MNAQASEVREWLEDVFAAAGDDADSSVPAYDFDHPSTLALLGAVAKESRERTAAMTLIENEMMRQAEEYRAEADRTEGVVQSVLGANAELSPWLTLSDVLAEVSVLLDADADADLSAALADLQLKAAGIPAEDLERERRTAESRERMVSALKDVGRNQKVLRASEADLRQAEEAASQSAKKLSFVSEKQREYARTAERQESLLRKAGYHRDVTHESLLGLKSELDALRAELDPLKEKLEGYKDLPPNLELAKARLAEARRDLEVLTHTLTKEINSMRL